MKKLLLLSLLLMLFSPLLQAFSYAEMFVLGAAGKVSIQQKYDGRYEVVKGITVVRVIKKKTKGGYAVCNTSGHEIGFVKANGEVYKGISMIGTVDMKKLLE
ncbi:MAG TPA: hypothetical protein PLB12_10830 [Candidatus Goldiibacteriota bacterium]|nr:hypothetical protein [Candidatus Goldiibacteriota bacterium]